MKIGLMSERDGALDSGRDGLSVAASHVSIAVRVYRHLQLKFASHVNSVGHLKLGAVHRTAGAFSIDTPVRVHSFVRAFEMKIVDSSCSANVNRKRIAMHIAVLLSRGVSPDESDLLLFQHTLWIAELFSHLIWLHKS